MPSTGAPLPPVEIAPATAQNGPVPQTGVGPTRSASDAERIRLRYPPPLIPKPVLIAVICVGVLLAGGWLIWVATVGANPPVSAQISAYTVQSDTRITATLTVDRPDPARPVACRVVAQATDFQPVAEQVVQVRASTFPVVNVRVDLTTLRRATTAVVRECWVV